MSKPLVVTIVIIAAVVVGIPLAANFMKSSSGSSSDTSSSSESAAPDSAAAPAAPAPAPAPGLAPAAAAAPAMDITNTMWAIKIQGVPVPLNVSFLPGGALQAQSPMLKAMVGTDTVGGSWSVSGANVRITASAGGKTVNETATISGDQLLVKGAPAQRLR